MKVQVQSESGHRYVGWAKNKLAILAKMRQNVGAPLLTKSLAFEGHLIFIRSQDGADLVRITGGAAQIALVSDERYYLYDFYAGALAASVPNGDHVSKQMDTAFNGWCSRENFDRFNGLSPVVKPFDNSFPKAGFVCGVNDYAMSVYQSGHEFYASTGAEIKPFATMPAGTHPSVPNGNYLNLFGFFSHPAEKIWNEFGTSTLYSVTPNSGVVSEIYNWVPSFFTVDPNDGYHLKPGWYYGKYPWSNYGIDQPLTSAEVIFHGMVKTKKESPVSLNGWCEQVLRVDGTPVLDLCFYLGTPQTGGTTYYERSIGPTSNGYVTIGAALTGSELLFRVKCKYPVHHIDWWSHAAWADGKIVNGALVDHFGLVVVADQVTQIYSCSPFPSLLLETTSYVHHSVSNDGTMLAVFTATSEGTGIGEVHVFDLFGTRIQKNSPAPEYSKGGVTVFPPKKDISLAHCTSGCFIPPKNKEGILECTLGYDFTAKAPTLEYESSLATLAFNISGNGAVKVSKLTCSQGVQATFSVTADPCFGGNKIVVDDPDLVDATDFLVSKWKYKGIIKGVVRGTFSGGVFTGIGTGSSGRYGVIELPSHFGILVSEDGSVRFDGYSGDVTPGECITEDDVTGELVIDPSCYEDLECSGGELTATATSSCGQTAEHKEEVDPPAELVMTSSQEVISGGSVVKVTGGVHPYTYGISCGSIGERTGWVSDIDGCCGAVTITVTDKCGTSVSMSFRGVSGQWVVIDEDCLKGHPTCGEHPYEDADCDISFCYCADTIYESAVSRMTVCKIPAWLPEESLRCKDGTLGNCRYTTEAWQC